MLDDFMSVRDFNDPSRLQQLVMSNSEVVRSMQRVVQRQINRQSTRQENRGDRTSQSRRRSNTLEAGPSQPTHDPTTLDHMGPSFPQPSPTPYTPYGPSIFHQEDSFNMPPNQQSFFQQRPQYHTSPIPYDFTENASESGESSDAVHGQDEQLGFSRFGRPIIRPSCGTHPRTRPH